MHSKRDLRSQSNRVLLAALFFPFVLSSIYWVLEVVQQAQRIDTDFIYPPADARDSPYFLIRYSSLFNALVLLNVGGFVPGHTAVADTLPVVRLHRWRCRVACLGAVQR